MAHCEDVSITMHPLFFLCILPHNIWPLPYLAFSGGGEGFELR